jgi:hypothetical protein
MAVDVVILEVLTDRKLPWNASNVWLELAEMTKLFGGEAIEQHAKELNMTRNDGVFRDLWANRS